MKQPEEIGGAGTQTAYLIVADADMHYEKARSAAAEIAMEIKDQDYGGRGYSCRDLEGRIWSIGTRRRAGPGGPAPTRGSALQRSAKTCSPYGFAQPMLQSEQGSARLCRLLPSLQLVRPPAPFRKRGIWRCPSWLSPP